jgi:SAM-dependent methyltransferase
MFSKTYHRTLLDKQLERLLPQLAGALLDIGSKNRRYDALLAGTVTAVDLVADTTKNVAYANLDEQLPFPEASFDGVLCIEVLEYVHDIQHAFSELRRVLKPGGILIASIPFLYHEHGDWARYTPRAMGDYAAHFSSVELKTFGNGWTVISDAVLKKSLGQSNFFLRVTGLMFLSMYSPLLRLFNCDQARDAYYSGILVVCRK